MRKNVLTVIYSVGLSLGLIGFAPVFFFDSGSFRAYAQFGNSISGHIFGPQRQPLPDITVELMDEFSRTIARARTNSAGRYFFNRISAGRFRIRVLPLGLAFEEQEQDVEIQNISREEAVRGYENVQRDFYLRPRRGSQPTGGGKTESLFVQEVPAQARETYKKAVKLLDDKNEREGLKELKTSIELFPAYFDALERLGLEYVRLKHFDAAQVLLQKAVEVNPRSYKSWYGLAYALFSLNIHAEALEAAEKANSLNQFSVESSLLSGVLLRQAKRYEQSEKELKRAKELAKGTVAEVHWHLALLYGNNLKRYREAADELELFLKARPDSKNVEEIKKLVKQFREKSQN